MELEYVVILVILTTDEEVAGHIYGHSTIRLPPKINISVIKNDHSKSLL